MSIMAPIYIFFIITGITGLSSMIFVVWITENYHEDIVRKIKLPSVVFSVLWDIGAYLCMALNGFIQRSDIDKIKKEIIFYLLFCIAIILVHVAEIKTEANRCLYEKVYDYIGMYDRGQLINVFGAPLIKVYIMLCITDGIEKGIRVSDFEFISEPVFIIALIFNLVLNVRQEYEVKKHYNL